jgi:hypothetical protein
MSILATRRWGPAFVDAPKLKPIARFLTPAAVTLPEVQDRYAESGGLKTSERGNRYWGESTRSEWERKLLQRQPDS